MKKLILLSISTLFGLSSFGQVKPKQITPGSKDGMVIVTRSGINTIDSLKWAEISGKPNLTTGTVTSVALSAPSSVFNVGGSPVTTSGTLSLTFKSQTAGQVFAAPTGSNGVPDFRALVAQDIPNLPASKITTGTFDPARLGTGTPGAGKYVDGGTGAWTALPAAPTVNDGTLTLATGTGLTGSATFTANQAGNSTFTVGLSSATATNIGGVELFSNTTQSVAANAVSSTAGRTYGIQLNSAGQAVVNVPWANAGGTVTNVSGTAPITVTNGSSTPNISIAKATGSTDGYLSSTDWATFNGKASLSDISATAPIIYNPGTGAIGVTTGNIVQGSNVTLSGTLTNRLVGSGNVTINADVSPADIYGTEDTLTHIVVAGDITSGVVSITLDHSVKSGRIPEVWINGVKARWPSITWTGATLNITNSQLPYNVTAGDEIDIKYVY